ncbi:uncharacterized protein LOC129949704 [Eupeodes corollae]|uniref:uncharacterized protein LOC129949704 n=1 Tax=Eupeodes corollae TaxID=290404 RepID=UPI00249232E3|nr:uncharacterized protein LOC129949704 [Eupeodes corollae]
MENIVNINSNKKRSNNFSSADIDLLMELIMKNKHIIENKKTDRVHWTEKTAAWESIANEFNSKSGSHYRSSIVLKTKYENLKKRTKQNFASEKRKLYQTGGGPQEINTDVLDKTILDLLGDQAQGLPSVYDNAIENEKHEETLIEQPEVKENQSPGSVNLTNDAKTKNIYASRKSTVLTARKRNLTGDKWQELAEEKCKLARLQQDKQALEIVQMKEVHEKKMLILDAELEKIKKEVSRMH